MAATKSAKGDNKDVVRFNIYLPRDAYESLERLREISGKRSLAETIRSALKLYMIVQEEMEDGKELILQGKTSEDRETIRLVF